MESEAKAGSPRKAARCGRAGVRQRGGHCRATQSAAVQPFAGVVTEELPNEEVRSRNGRRAAGARIGYQRSSAKEGLGSPVSHHEIEDTLTSSEQLS